MSKFVFTPELTKEEAQRITDALKFQAQHKKYASRIDECVEKLLTKELINKLKKVAKLQYLSQSNEKKLKSTDEKAESS